MKENNKTRKKLTAAGLCGLNCGRKIDHQQSKWLCGICLFKESKRIQDRREKLKS